MMHIMSAGFGPNDSPYVISGVSKQSLHHGSNDKYPKSDDMHLEDSRWGRDWNNVRHNMFNWVCVLHCKSRGSTKFMMHFMDMSVEDRPMKDPVAVVKQSLSSDGTKHQADDNFPNR